MIKTLLLTTALASIVLHDGPRIDAGRQADGHRAEWPQWRGPSRDGVASTFTTPATWPAQLTKTWQVKVGLGHSSPVVSGNRVVIHTRLANREVLSAYDLASGKQIWQDAVDAPYTMNPAATGHGPGPKSTPAIASGRVFTMGISGIFSAHDLATGKLLWRKATPSSPQEYGTSNSPIVDGSSVIAYLGGQRGGALTAMDAATGKEKWQWTGDVPGYASPIIATLAGTRQLITQSESKVIGLAVDNGRLLWQVPLKTPYNQNVVTPLVVNGAATGPMLISAGLENPTIAYRIGNGPPTAVWRNEQVSMYMSSPAASGTAIFGLSTRNRGQFFAIDAATGKTLWLSKGREADNASIVRAGDYLLMATTNSELIVARPSTTAFEEIRRYTIADSATWAHPAYVGRNIIVKDVDTLTAWSF
jgi:outer membrane protein assembly factor BamB